MSRRAQREAGRERSRREDSARTFTTCTESLHERHGRRLSINLCHHLRTEPLGAPDSDWSGAKSAFYRAAPARRRARSEWTDAVVRCGVVADLQGRRAGLDSYEAVPGDLRFELRRFRCGCLSGRRRCRRRDRGRVVVQDPVGTRAPQSSCIAGSVPGRAPRSGSMHGPGERVLIGGRLAFVRILRQWDAR